MVKERNIAVCIILSIVTCGIYGLYWLCVMNDESKAASNDQTSMSGGLVVLLSIITCGIYLIYWNYIMGKRMQTAMNYAGLQSEDRSLVYLILSIFALSIISYCLIQNDLNSIVAAKNNGNNGNNNFTTM